MHICVPCQGEDSAALVFRVLSEPFHINAWRKNSEEFDAKKLAACVKFLSSYIGYTSTPLTGGGLKCSFAHPTYLDPSFAALQPESDQPTAPGISVGAAPQSETHHLTWPSHRQRSRDGSHDPRVPREDEGMDAARSVLDARPTWNRAGDSSSGRQWRAWICQAQPFGTLCQRLQPTGMKGYTWAHFKMVN